MTNGFPPHEGLVTEGEARCTTADETRALAATFAAVAVPGLVLSLEGPLGAGKTEFVKGFVAAIGHAGEVSSPTFTLLHEYVTGRLPVVHFDWYRLEDAQEVIGVGWDDYLDGGEVLLVEWGDRFPELLPAAALRMRFQIEGEARVIRWGNAA